MVASPPRIARTSPRRPGGSRGVFALVALVVAMTLVACADETTSRFECVAHVCTSAGCTDFSVADVCATSSTSATTLCESECYAAADGCSASSVSSMSCGDVGLLARRDSDTRFTVDTANSWLNHTNDDGVRDFEVALAGQIYVSGSWCDGCDVTFDSIELAQEGAAESMSILHPTGIELLSMTRPEYGVSTSGAPGTFAGTLFPGGALFMEYRAEIDGRTLDRRLYNPGPMNAALMGTRLVAIGELGESIDAHHAIVLELEPSNRRPSAVASVTYDAATSDVHLDATATTDPDPTDVLLYLWNDETGARVGEAADAHVTAPSGAHAFTLTVVDSAGASSVQTKSVTIP